MLSLCTLVLCACGRPAKVVKFALKSEQATSVGGLAEWDSVDEALQAVLLANHSTIDSPADSPYPYNVKLIFSTVPISETRAQRVREHCAQQQRGEDSTSGSASANANANGSGKRNGNESVPASSGAGPASSSGYASTASTSASASASTSSEQHHSKVLMWPVFLAQIELAALLHCVHYSFAQSKRY